MDVYVLKDHGRAIGVFDGIVAAQSAAEGLHAPRVGVIPHGLEWVLPDVDGDEYRETEGAYAIGRYTLNAPPR